jgi:hypothetical protein
MTDARDASEVRALASLSESPNEAAQMDVSIDPLNGYDAAEIALRLFDSRRLEDFSAFLKSNALTPNIVLPSGLTLLQSSLLRYPADGERLETLLGLGAHPNLFFRRIDQEDFGSNAHRASYHPLNYAFANVGTTTTPEVCRVLRKYGASVEGLRNYFEVDPALALPDTPEKAALRKELIGMQPDAELGKAARNDVDMSIRQKLQADMETQVRKAGFEVVTYVPRQRQQQPSAQAPTDLMVPLFSNYRLLTPSDLKRIFDNNLYSKRVPALLNYKGYSGTDALYPALFENSNGNRLAPTILALELASTSPTALYGWAPASAKASPASSQNNVKVTFVPDQYLVADVSTNPFTVSALGIYSNKDGQKFFYDPAMMGIRLIDDDTKVSIADRSDIFGEFDAVASYLEIKIGSKISTSVVEATYSSPKSPTHTGNGSWSVTRRAGPV